MQETKTSAKLAATLAAALLAACAMLAVGSMPAHATALETLDSLKGTQHVFYYPKDRDCNVVEVGYSQDTDKACKVKSSNPKVASAKAIHKGTMLRIMFKKAGTAKVSYVYKGKKHTVKYVVAKYVNPVKSFKVGGKEFKGQFQAGEFGSAPYTASGKLSVKAAKGWKLLKMESDMWSKSLESIKTKAVKNGYRASDDRDLAIRATLKNKKSGVKETVTLYLGQPICLS